MGLEKTLESPLEYKKIQPVHSEGDQPWDFFGRNAAKAAIPVLWPPHGRVDSLEKTLMLGGIGSRSRRGQQRMRWLDGITDSMNMVKVKVKLLSHVQLFATSWTVAYQASPSMGFPRQEYWSGLPFPSPGVLPDPGIEPGSPALEADALTSAPPTS